MSEARIGERSLRGATPRDGVATSARSAAHWLSLAASPVFAVMALLTATHDGGAADILCSAVHGSSPLDGMTLMYVLMSVFHASSWLRLISMRRDRQPTAF